MLKSYKWLRQANGVRRFQHTAALETRLKKGDKLHNYTVLNDLEVPEMHLRTTHLKHKSGAEHLHVSKDDSDNVFAVAFRTPPTDSTGVTHILEHTALCGSSKFPVRDPFFKMLTRSLSTFMNAFTANDWTMYPFSTQNPVDFTNLMRVYLDAAFKPLLRKQDFLQEGWRLEHSGDQASPLELKGVVYNEMKGVFGDLHQVFAQASLNHLHSSGPYSFVSGGHPNDISNLSWKQLRDFHSHHYHPANARFFTYGNLPLEEHLSIINSHLDSPKQPPHSTTILPQQRWSTPQKINILTPPDPLSPDPELSNMVAVSYLLCDVTKAQECFELSFLSTLLTDGPQSPFYRALLESGLGAEYTAGTGFSSDARDASFSVGVQRCHKSKVDEVVGVIEKVLSEVVDEGFPEDRIASLLHRIELALKHQSNQFGLKLLLSIIPAWNHGAEPTHLLQVTRHVDELKKRLLKEPTHLQQLVTKHLSRNPHHLILTSHPDPNHPSTQLQAEQKLLASLTSTLTEERKMEVWKEAQELKEAQEKEEDVTCLPCLRVEDIARETEEVECKRVEVEGVGAHVITQPTNGVTYVRMVLDASHLPPHLLSHLPLFCHLLTAMGTSHMDFRTQSGQMDLYTGGLSASPLLSSHPSLPHHLQTAILLTSHCLDRNVNVMVQLWHDILTSLSLADVDRMAVLLSSLAADSASVLAHDGHRLAMKHSASLLHAHLQQLEQLEGVTQMNVIKGLVAVPPQQLAASMQELSQLLLPASLLRSSVNCQAAAVDGALQALAEVHSCVPRPPSEDLVFVPQPLKASFANSHFRAPFQVNYLAQSFPTVPLCHPDHAPLRLLASLLSSKYLHKQIREKGGAYGGGCVAGSNVLSFFSYRDPSPLTSLETFSHSKKWLSSDSFQQQQLHETKLSVFSQVDKPHPPGSKGLRHFLHAIGHQEWHEVRQALLRATPDDLRRVADIYLTTPSSTTLIGPPIDSPSDFWTHHQDL